VPGLSGIVPSYAAQDGMGIVGSSVAEVKAVIDAHVTGSTITADPTYQAAAAASLSRPVGILYLNVANLVTAIEKLPTAGTVDTKTAANLSHVKSFMLTGSSQSGSAVERFVIAIQ